MDHLNFIKSIFKAFGTLLGVFVIVVLILSLSVLFLSKTENRLNLKVFNITSGSMNPTLKVGSLVLTQPQNDYWYGDIITFSENNKLTNTTTHRIVEIEKNDGKISYITKGDANEDVDLKLVTDNMIVGKTLFSVPYIGYLVNYSQTRNGYILLVVIPAIIIILIEMKSIFTEIFKILKKQSKQSLNTNLNTTVKSILY